MKRTNDSANYNVCLINFMIENKNIISNIYRKSPFVIFVKLLYITLFFDILFLAIDYNDNSKITFNYNIVSFFFSNDFIVSICLIFIQIIVISIVIINWYNEYFIIKSNFLVYKKWLLFKSEKNFILNNIKSITTNAWFFWKIFNCGEIVIESDIQEKIRISNISNTDWFIKLIWEQRNKIN
jgi:hypothetical protein